MTNITNKEQLKTEWEKYKNEQRSSRDDKFRDLIKEAYNLIDTSELDEWINNYDFAQINQIDHRIMGKKFPGWTKLEKNIEEDNNYQEYPSSVSDSYPELGGFQALKKMAQKVLAECYIEMNRLLHGEDTEWEAKINWIANSWTNTSLQAAFEINTTAAEREELPQKIQAKLISQNIEVR